MTADAVIGQVVLLLAAGLVAGRMREAGSRRVLLLTGATLLLVLCLGLAGLRAVLPHQPAVLVPVLLAAAGIAATAYVCARWGGPGAVGVALALALLVVLAYLTQVRLTGGDGSDGYGRWAVLGIVAFAAAVPAGRLLPGTPSGPALQWVALGALLLPALPGLGVTINGARAWIAVGSYTIQPVEFARPLLVAGLALSLEANAPLLRHGIIRYAIGAVLPVGLAVGLLAAVHHDLGPALVLGGTALILVLLLRPPRRIVLTLLAVPPLAAVVAFALVARLQERVEHWWRPVTADGALQNTGAALEALARGGWLGTGLGRGTPTAVANVDNDFALVAVAEERGLLGVAVYVVLLALICRHLLVAATGIYDDQRRLLVLAPAVMLWVQAGYVVLATAGIAPVTGMVVPLLSSGGSALIATGSTVGVLLGLHGSAAGAPLRTVGWSRFQAGIAVLKRVAVAVWLVAGVGFVVVMSGTAVPARASSGERGRVLGRDGTVLAGPLFGHAVGYPSLSGVEASAAAMMTCAPTWLASLAGRRCTPSDVLTGLDGETQRVAAEALGSRTGSVVVLDVRDFTVIADYTSPAVDPEHLGETYGERVNALRDPAVAVASAPGSTFKLITAAAMLERGLPTEVMPRAAYQTPEMPVAVRNAGHATCGGDLTEVLAVSCNTAFAEYALTLGTGRMRETAAGFGYGTGLMPGSEVEAAAVGSPGDASAVARTGLGLQDVRATPLQQAVVAATIAAGGERRPVRFVVGTCRGNDFSPAAPGPVGRVVRPPTAATITTGMRAAVQYGTATGMRDLPFPVAAKTGTADAADGRTDGWLVGFAPADRPLVAVAVRIPGTSDRPRAGGADDAVPVAAAVLPAAVAAAGSEPACRNRN